MPLRKSMICGPNSGRCIRVCGMRNLSAVALESDCSDCAYVVDPTRKRHANLAQHLVLRRTSVRTIRRNSSSSQRKTGQKLQTEVDNALLDSERALNHGGSAAIEPSEVAAVLLHYSF